MTYKEDECSHCTMPYKVTIARRHATFLKNKESAIADAKAIEAATETAGEAEEEGWKPAKGKRKSRKARKAQERKEKGQSEEVWEEPEAMEEDEEEEEESDCELVEVPPLPALSDMAAWDKVRTRPLPLREGWSAASVVGKSDVSEEAASLAALQTALGRCTSLLELSDTEAANCGVDKKVAATKKAELEKAIVKAGKPVKATKVTAAALRLQKEQYEDAYSERAKGPVAGAAKGRAAFVKLQLAQQAYLDYWLKQRNQTAQDELERLELWKARTELKLEQHRLIVAEFDAKISAAATAAGETVAAAAAAPEASAAPLQPARPCPVAKTATVKDLYLTADISPAELPVPKPLLDTDTEKIAEVQALWGGIEAVAALPGAVPASFAQLGATAALAETLVGSVVWKKYYAARTINDDDVVPRHLILRLSTQLTKLAEAYAKATENTQAAKERLESAFGIADDHFKGKGKGIKNGADSTPYGSH